ncbi:hypothetical protein [Orrella sp. 11846]|uniref:hypothetical protein n=1 Tax=Orrella sp. 11846 TaxID=3409913 RepID=UPI003B5A2B99
MDRAWWSVYLSEVKEVFTGQRVSPTRHIPQVEHVNACGKNSGIGAILFAGAQGAKRIILLGYDAKAADGEHHWHGNHPEPLTNPAHYGRWQREFADVAKQTHHLQILNSSRDTALDCWPQVPLEEALVYESAPKPKPQTKEHA